MSRTGIERAIRDLGWSLWTELGIPGVVRNHQGSVLDPERLVVVSPSIFPLDPRLRDQAFAWCSAHSNWLSVSRLQGLAENLEEPERRAFDSFAATLRQHAKVRWPSPEDTPTWPSAPVAKVPGLPIERPALLRFRLRALSGVGARADVICALLAREGVWTRASDLEPEGYTKRNVARILSELAEAGIARSRPERNLLTYKLEFSDSIREIASGEGLVFPDWSSILNLVLVALRLVALEPRSAATRRVEAHKCRGQLLPLSESLGLKRPPMTRGSAEAWEEMLGWLAEQAEKLAAGV